MRALGIATILLAGSFMASAATAQSAPTAGEEAAVRAVALHEIDGWNKFDTAQIASCYTEDTIWQNPFGVRFHNRQDLQTFLTKLFQRPGYRSAKDTEPAHITDIHILSPPPPPSGSKRRAKARSTTRPASP